MVYTSVGAVRWQVNGPFGLVDRGQSASSDFFIARQHRAVWAGAGVLVV